MSLKHLLLLLCLVSFAGAQKSKQKPVAPVPPPIEGITESQLYAYLSFIASDELEGRDTPSRGLNIAAKFIATNLSRWGVVPAGDPGSYFQKIALTRTKVRPSATTLALNGQSFAFGTDYIPAAIAGTVTAPLVFAKEGYVVKAKNLDPYAGLDVKGKIIVVTGGMPRSASMADFKGKIGQDYDTPANIAKTRGAAALVVINYPQSPAQWERTRASAVDRGTLTVPAFKKEGEIPAVPTVNISAKLADVLFAGEKTGASTMSVRNSADSVAAFALSPSKSLAITVGVAVESLSTQNIVGMIPGTDSVLQDEFVAFGAHYDHIGIRSEPVNGDSINNGADDDGSGTVGLLAMAESFSKGPRPKRSLLFVWHVGEEKGLWGSKFFVEHPTVPLSNVITQLNIDMIGRSRPDTGEASKNQDYSGPNEVFSIGSKMMSTQLGTLNEENNNGLFKLSLNYKFDDPADPNRLFYRSDHYNYAKSGVPIVFFFDGIHEDYHRVSDEVQKIDFTKLMKVTRTVASLGWKLANLPKRPVVDKQFDRDVMD